MTGDTRGPVIACHSLTILRSILSRRAKEVWLERLLRAGAVLVPPVAIVGEASGFSVAMPIIIRQAVTQRRTHNVCLAAVLGILVLRLAANVDDRLATVAHRLEHPHDVVAMGVDRVRKVEAAATTLGASDDKEVREALRVETEKGLGALGVPRLLDTAAVTANRRVEQSARHPLEPGRIDQHI
jgi:hypothetical protein